MDRDSARKEICSRWREIITGMTVPARKKVRGEITYVCPFCGHGSHGDGITEIPASKNSKTDTVMLKCFGPCGWSGNIIDMYMKVHGVDFSAAFNDLTHELGINVDHSSSKTNHSPVEKSMETADFSEYYKRCEERLPKSEEALSYLAKRGISVRTASALHIGFDPEADPANAPGLMPGKIHPSPRIIIPTSKSHYIGRSTNPDMKQYAKLNPSMNKGAGSPGIFNCVALYSGHKIVFVTEGAFDAMSLCEIGQPAIAINSVDNGEHLIDLMKKKPTTARLIICFDNDPNPQTHQNVLNKAAELKNALNALAITCDVFDIAPYTKDGEKDINDILRRSPDAARKMAEAAAAVTECPDLVSFMQKVESEAYRPYRTGLTFFDDLLGGGVVRQSLLLLMAAPGTGKTTLCQQIAEAMALNHKPVIYLNFEMSKEQMLAKAISGQIQRSQDPKINTSGRKIKSESTLDVLQGYRWTAEDKAEIEAAVKVYQKNSYPYIRYNPDNLGTDVDDVLGYLRRIGDRAKASGRETPVVVCDYLHLLSSSKGLEVQELIKQAVTGLKGYAKDYDTFVIGIVATNRDSSSKGKVSLWSGRDSSNLEFTGDYVLSLNQYDIDKGDVTPDDAKKVSELQKAKWQQMIIRVLKNRFGIAGKSAKLYFYPAGNTFYSETDWMPDDDERGPFISD